MGILCFGSDILWEQLSVLMNADTLNSNTILIKPTDSDMEGANNANNLLDPNDIQDGCEYYRYQDYHSWTEN